MRPRGEKTWVEISRKAILSNLTQLAEQVKPARLMCILKSNAYGHGLVEVASICQKQADWFGVYSINEAIVLRRKSVKKPILVMGYTVSEHYQAAIEQDVSLTVYSCEAIRGLAKVAKRLNKVVNIHLKLETGLTRQGVTEEDLSTIIACVKRYKSYVALQGVFMHYANVEDTSDTSYAFYQLERFEQGVACLERAGFTSLIRHTASSAPAMILPTTRHSMVRVGISLYGLWPSDKTRAAQSKQKKRVHLEPALTWKTMVVQVKKVKKSTPVSYGLTERVMRDSVVAVLPIGYWDGYDRVGMSRQAHVLIRGERCKVLGRVCMNMCMVDVTGVKGVREGDEVVLLGKQGKEEVTADELAELAGTISYEIVTRINPEILRIIK